MQLSLLVSVQNFRDAVDALQRWALHKRSSQVNVNS